MFWSRSADSERRSFEDSVNDLKVGRSCIGVLIFTEALLLRPILESSPPNLPQKLPMDSPFQKELRYSVPDRMERPPCHKCTRFALRGWISIKKSLSKTLEKAQKAYCSAKIKWKLKTRRSFPPHNLQKYDTYLRQCAVYKSTNIEAWQHHFPGHKNETKLQHICDKSVTN